MNKTITLPITVTLVIVFTAISFYGGVQFQKKRTGNTGQSFQRTQMLGAGAGSGGQRQGMAGQRAGGVRGENFLAGEVLKTDDKSVTIKLNDGGSKTAYFTASTTVDKSATGALADLLAGTSVMINGKANADGSINAELIQIRPQLRPTLR